MAVLCTPSSLLFFLGPQPTGRAPNEHAAPPAEMKEREKKAVHETTTPTEIVGVAVLNTSQGALFGLSLSVACLNP